MWRWSSIFNDSQEPGSVMDGRGAQMMDDGMALATSSPPADDYGVENRACG